MWFDDITNRKDDIAIGAVVSTLLDPSDHFNAWCGKNGPQNSSWNNRGPPGLSGSS
jgi:peptide/nickel transport system substrate-binding protein